MSNTARQRANTILTASLLLALGLAAGSSVEGSYLTETTGASTGGQYTAPQNAPSGAYASAIGNSMLPELALAYWDPSAEKWLYFPGHADASACGSQDCNGETRPDMDGNTHDADQLDYDAAGVANVDLTIKWEDTAGEMGDDVDGATGDPANLTPAPERPYHIRYVYPEHQDFPGSRVPAPESNMAEATDHLFSNSISDRFVCMWSAGPPGLLHPWHQHTIVAKWSQWDGAAYKVGIWQFQFCLP